MTEPSETSPPGDPLAQPVVEPPPTLSVQSTLADILSRLEALEEGLESLAKRAVSETSPELHTAVGELQRAVASLGGTLLGYRSTRDGGKGFLAWIESALGLAPQAPPGTPDKAAGSTTSSTVTSQSASGAKVENVVVHPREPSAK